MPDIKNYGIKGIGSDVQLGKQSGRIIYNTNQDISQGRNRSYGFSFINKLYDTWGHGSP